MATAAAMKPSEVNAFGHDKIDRYGWTSKDSPGAFMMIPKRHLRVNHEYQREVNKGKVLEIQKQWSWLACSTILVALRDGTYWVIDGQHRVLAANNRSDIADLPCLVFQTKDVPEEAGGFLDANTGRKPVSAIAKHRARVARQDEVAIKVQASFDTLNLKLGKSATQPGEIGCVAWAYRRAEENFDEYLTILTLGTELCRQEAMAIPERLLDGLWYLNRYMDGGLAGPRLNRRLRDVGARRLLDSAMRAAAYYSRGGARVFANGMLEEINKNLRHKFSLTNAS